MNKFLLGKGRRCIPLLIGGYVMFFPLLSHGISIPSVVKTDSISTPLNLTIYNNLNSISTSLDTTNNRFEAISIPIDLNKYSHDVATYSTKKNNLPTSIYFQQTISGIISDSQGPLAGVTVRIKGTDKGVISDIEGKYSITANANDVLVFSYMGYITQERLVGNSSQFSVILVEDTKVLQEVVVNAGYYTVKDKERTGSIATVKSEAIEKQPVANILGALQGRMAGVNITQSTGVPGGGFSIEIRGRNSIRPEANQPLYIVDGMPFSSESLGNTAISGPILPGSGINPLNAIHPSDIESVTVLKDADATAIYGSRGANGVVLITTKKGKAKKVQFTLNTYSGAGTITRKLDLLNTQQYLEMREEAFENDGISTLPFWAYDVNGTWDRNRYTDWQKELIGGTSNVRSVQLGVSGGSSTTQFMVSGTHYNETTVFPGDFGYKKSSFHFSISHASPSDRLRLQLSGIYVADENDLLPIDLTRTAITLAPNAPALYDADGNLNWENSTWENPLRLLNGKYLSKTKGLNLGGRLGYNLAKDLEFAASIGYNDTRVQELSTTPHTIYNPAFGLTSAISSAMFNNSFQHSWNIEPQLEWKKTFNNSKFSILLGSTFQEREASQLTNYAMGFASNSLITNLNAATTTQVMNHGENVYRYAAVFGRVNYIYKDTYILNLTGRRDGSSRFGPGNQFATFGAVGGAWLFSNYDVVREKLPFLSFGKLRSSYGTTGSDQIGDYQFLNTYMPTGIPYAGVIGLQPTRLFNADFSWEVNKKFEVALETGFLNDRIFFTAGYFSNRSSNQLVGIPLPGTTGFTSVQSNLNAEVANSGLEFELRTVNFSGSNFNWTTSLNFTSVRNKLLSFPDLEGSVYANQLVIGQPLGIRKVYSFTGVDPNTGLFTFEDYNGDGLLTSTEDRQKLVDTTPDFYGGIQNSITYKNWNLDFLFQFVKQVGLNSVSTSDLPGSASNMPVSVLDRWQTVGDTSGGQLFTAGFNGDAVNNFYSYYINSDAAYTDASFVRLKNLSLSYTLPKTLMKEGSCKLYFQGQNLLTFTKFQGADPENQSQGRLPTLRMLTLGVQLSF